MVEHYAHFRWNCGSPTPCRCSGACSSFFSGVEKFIASTNASSESNAVATTMRALPWNFFTAALHIVLPIFRSLSGQSSLHPLQNRKHQQCQHRRPGGDGVIAETDGHADDGDHQRSRGGDADDRAFGALREDRARTDERNARNDRFDHTQRVHRDLIARTEPGVRNHELPDAQYVELV